jgi:predicted lipoprotein
MADDVEQLNVLPAMLVDDVVVGHEEVEPVVEVDVDGRRAVARGRAGPAVRRADVVKDRRVWSP